MNRFLIAAFGLLIAGSLPAAAAQDQTKVQAKAQQQTQQRARFVDQNGDGICDFARDHDNDGVPNCQDPDWKRPQDGTGNKARLAKGAGNQTGSRGPGWKAASFWGGRGQFGSGVCDGTGPKGKGPRPGRG